MEILDVSRYNYRTQVIIKYMSFANMFNIIHTENTYAFVVHNDIKETQKHKGRIV